MRSSYDLNIGDPLRLLRPLLDPSRIRAIQKLQAMLAEKAIFASNVHEYPSELHVHNIKEKGFVGGNVFLPSVREDVKTGF